MTYCDLVSLFFPHQRLLTQITVF